MQEMEVVQLEEMLGIEANTVCTNGSARRSVGSVRPANDGAVAQLAVLSAGGGGARGADTGGASH